jgi:hypothetical protein
MIFVDSATEPIRTRSSSVELITPAAKKVIYQPEARARDPVRFPRWRVGLICSSMRNFLAGVIPSFAIRMIASRFPSLRQGDDRHAKAIGQRDDVGLVDHDRLVGLDCQDSGA